MEGNSSCPLIPQRECPDTNTVRTACATVTTLVMAVALASPAPARLLTAESNSSTMTALSGATRAADSAGAVARQRVARLAGRARVRLPDREDTASGTSGRPFAPSRPGAGLAPAGGTVVLRAGRYHESVDGDQAGHDPELPRRRGLAGRQQPGQRLGQGRDDAGARRLDHAFDHSPTYTQGATRLHSARLAVRQPRPPDGRPPRPGLDRRACSSSRSPRAPGRRRHVLPRRGDLAALRRHDPTGKEVRASTLAAGPARRGRRASCIRGIGVRRYAP